MLCLVGHRHQGKGNIQTEVQDMDQDGEVDQMQCPSFPIFLILYFASVEGGTETVMRTRVRNPCAVGRDSSPLPTPLSLVTTNGSLPGLISMAIPNRNDQHVRAGDWEQERDDGWFSTLGECPEGMWEPEQGQPLWVGLG